MVHDGPWSGWRTVDLDDFSNGNDSYLMMDDGFRVNFQLLNMDMDFPWLPNTAERLAVTSILRKLHLSLASGPENPIAQRASKRALF